MRRLNSTLLVLFSITVSICILSLPEGAAAEMSSRAKKGYNVYGSIGLIYDMSWLQDLPAESEFTQDLKLGVRGYAIDPRLVNFDLSGELTNTEATNGSDSFLKGVNLSVNLLETQQQQWKGARRFIPGPISLHYSKYSDSYDLTSYGASLIYSIPNIFSPDQRKKATQDKKAEQLSLPTIFFDYDRYDYESGSFRNINDTYSIRSTLRGKNFFYRFLYENLNQTGARPLKKTKIELQPDYRFYDKSARTLLTINNLLSREESNQTENITLSSSTFWQKPLEKDMMSLSGSASYSGSSDETSTEISKSQSFTVAGSGAYTRVFSPRLSDTATLSLAYGRDNDTSRHSERLRNSTQFDLSRIFRVNGDLFLGVSQNGAEYGLGATIYTKTRIAASAGYSHTTVYPDEGSTSSHAFSLSASGPLVGRLTFTSNARYTTKSVANSTAPYSEDQFYISSDIYWRFLNTFLTFGGNFTRTNTDDGVSADAQLTALHANLSRLLFSGAHLNVYSTWTRDAADKVTAEFRPNLTWRLRQVSLELEYMYRANSAPGSSALDEQRIFARLTRGFSLGFR